ncbi:MAG: glycosyltransferase [Oligoflexales bacterium]
MRRLKVLTWHVHGSYLYYLSMIDHDLYLPVNDQRSGGYIGRTPSYPWLQNIREVHVDEISRHQFDCILFQTRENYMFDQYKILSTSQLELPKIYLEHDPPREHPTDTIHVVDDPNVLVVHVTNFNDLMWDCQRSPTKVIQHGVCVPGEIGYTGEFSKGIVVVNNLRKRGRRLGADIYDNVRDKIPLDLIGMGWCEADGIGEVPHKNLASFVAPYRFFFNPIRYTSLGLAICEAMMVGLPIIGLATTELVSVVENYRSGLVSLEVPKLVEYMRHLLAHPGEAAELGRRARATALERFNIKRFVRDWDDTLFDVCGSKTFENIRERRPESCGLQ